VTDPTKHNYYQKLVDLHAQGKIPSVGFSEVDIAHDNWCGIYQGGYCDCDPEVRVRPRPTPPPVNPSTN
jgi:hypothetical protein